MRRADAGEPIIDAHGFLQFATDEDDASEEKIAALAEMICRAGDEPETKSAALLVLMSTLESFFASESAGEYGEALCVYSLR